MDCPGAARVGSVAKRGRRATGGAQLCVDGSPAVLRDARMYRL